MTFGSRELGGVQLLGGLGGRSFKEFVRTPRAPQRDPAARNPLSSALHTNPSGKPPGSSERRLNGLQEISCGLGFGASAEFTSLEWLETRNPKP